MQTRSGTRSTSKRLVETVTFQLVTSGMNHGEMIEQMLVEYNLTAYSELSVLLSAARAIALAHQLSHWTASGDPFYGDHLLFDRLYNSIVPEIDRIAEKAVGMGGAELLNPTLQVKHEAQFISVLCPNSNHVPRAEELVRRSYEAEMHFMGFMDALVKNMATNGRMTLGMENMLGEIADNHEAAVYLLKQRVIG